MAFPVVASTSTGGGSSDAIIPKPSGLAVGDLMIAYACDSTLSTGSGAVMSAPVGWTLIRQDTPNASFTAASYYKVADAGDVAATNFTFQGTTGATGNGCAGFIARITGHDPSLFLSASNSNSGAAGTTVTTSGITPSYNSLLLLCASGVKASAQTVSGQAIANNNPSWTELFDTSGAGTNDRDSISLATASYPLTSATGNSTLTFAASMNFWSEQIIAIQPPKITPSSVSAASAVGTPTFVLLMILSAISSAASVGAAVASAVATKWSNLTKHSASSTNLPKS